MTKKTPTRDAFFIAESETVCPSLSDSAKIGNPRQKTKDLTKVLEYFRYKLGTTLDCALSTGILRNSITWYVCELEDLGLLRAVKKAKDSTTGFIAKHYSADPSLWPKPSCVQLKIWEE